MSKIKFLTSGSAQEVVFSLVSDSVVDLIFTESPTKPELQGGFEVLNEYNDTVMGVYGKFTTIYRTFEDNPLHFQLSNDGSVYTPPVVKTEAIITFKGTDHLTPSFTEKTVTIGTDLSDILFPAVKSNDPEYSLDEWSQASGKITDDFVVEAREKYEHVPTLEEVRQEKIAELAQTCEEMIVKGVNVSINGAIEHFSYTTEDQSNIDDLVSMISATGLDQPYHADNKLCKLYTPEQIMAIYTAQKVNKTHHITYYNSLKAYVLSLTNKDAIRAVTYGQQLEDKYLENYNMMMKQAQVITEAVAANMKAQSAEAVETKAETKTEDKTEVVEPTEE